MDQQNYWTRRRLGRRAVLRGAFMGAAGLAGAALIGCGGEEGPAAGTAPAGTAAPGGATGTPAAGASPAASGATRGGTLKFGYHGDPGFLSPRLSRSGFDNAFLLANGDNYVYVKADGTIDFDRSLFENFEYSTPTTLVAQLRNGVKFHDETPLDSEAVKAHLEFLMDPEKADKFGYRSLLEPITGIQTPDATTVQIELSEPDAGFVAGLAVAPGIPFSIDQVEKLGDDEILNPAATGPYRVESYSSGSEWTYTKNEAFWGPADKEPYLDKLVYKVITESETRAAALESGEIDATWFTSSNETTARLAKNTDIQSRSFSVGPTLLTINQNMAPLDNLKLRQAIAHAIDKSKLLEAIYQGQGDIAKSMLPPGVYGYVEYEPYPYDPERAKQLVQESGVPTPVRIKYAYGGTPPSAAAVLEASLYKEMLDAVGFDVQLENVPGSGAIFDALFENRTHHIGSFSTGVRPDPGAQYALYVTSYAFYNAGRDTSDPVQAKLDDLVSRAKSELDPKAREELYFEIAKTQLDNVYSQIPIVARIRWAFANQNVGGFDNPEFLNTPAGASFRSRLLWLKA